MKFISLVFPIRNHLNILQLEEYKYPRYLKWVFTNFFKQKKEAKKPLVVTSKIKNILITAIFGDLLISLVFLIQTKNILLCTVLFLLLLSQPYLLFGLSLLILKPYEKWNRIRTLSNTRAAITKFKKEGLKVIAITGSYGKTSTKEILYQILKEKYKVLRTPESYNTLFGITKVVELELSPDYDYFICEMAAYKKGEIKELCQMIPPDFGIITGITPQHLERFGSLKNIVQAKFELYDAIKDKNNIFLNTKDSEIAEELKNRNSKIRELTGPYNLKLTSTASYFDLKVNDSVVSFTTNLFGSSQVINIAAAINIASFLGVDMKTIKAKVQKLTPFSNRFVLKQFRNINIIDNTYSSNYASFKETILTAKEVTGTKVLVTPGIVELGDKEAAIHQKLGKLAANVFDKVVLVGDNKRTRAFFKGYGNKAEFIDDSREVYQTKIEQLKKEFTWIFLENDLTQNY